MEDHRRAAGSAPTWQHLKSAYPTMWNEMFESKIRPPATSLPVHQDPNALPPIRLIEFEAFCRETEFPRYPERKELCVTLDSIDRASSFIVFISHCWLRGWSGARDWDGRPHPDSKFHEKFRLCKAGIRKALNIWAPDLPRCYVWLDFGCMDQDGNPAGELKQLDEIVRVSDCLFTPVVGHPTIAENFRNFYEDYQLPAWNAPQYGYTSRGWCRVEMFYASNIPYDANAQRLSKFRHALQHHASEGRRAHLLYTTEDIASDRVPSVLPPLQNSYYDTLDPAKGHVTMPSDKQKIAELIEALRPYMRRVVESYEGGLYDGKRQGYGVYRYADGKVYEGDWHDNLQQGRGTLKFPDGSFYEGDWHGGMKHGKGVFKDKDGARYEGMWFQGHRQGKGTQLFNDGSIYEGQWQNDNRHGSGSMKFLDGSVLSGGWDNNGWSGLCSLQFANGNKFKGQFTSSHRMEGTFVFANSDVKYFAKISKAPDRGSRAPIYDAVLEDPNNKSAVFRKGRLVAGAFE
jgi:hypothetical protein